METSSNIQYKPKLRSKYIVKQKDLYQLGESERYVPYSELSSSYLIIFSCCFAISRSQLSSSIFYRQIFYCSACFFLVLAGCLTAISYRKCLSLFDSYFNLPKFSSSFLTYPGCQFFFKMNSLELCPFLTVFLTPSSSSYLLIFDGLSKEMDFFKIDFSFGSGMLDCIDQIISAISFYKGLETGAISERLKADIILTISKRFTSLLLRFYSLTYSSKQFDTILKSQIFYFSFSLKSPADCLRLVIVELPFTLDYSTFFVRFMTLIVCLLFFLLFLFYKMLPLLSFPLLSLEAELFDCAKLMQGVQCSCLIIDTGSFSSVLTLVY